MSNVDEGFYKLEGGSGKIALKAIDRETSKPLVSIITIVYNDRSNIERTIQSVLRQTYKHIEYIVIDGGSHDGTLEVIKNYDHAIAYWLSGPDKGISDAFNRGIAKATGEWLIFLNSSDTFSHENVVSRLVNYANKARIITGFAKVGNKLLPKRSIMNSEPIQIRAMISHQASMIHKSIFDSFGGFDCSFKIRMDYDFWLRVLSRTPFYFVDEVFVDFAPGGISGDIIPYFREEIRANRKNLGGCGFLSPQRLFFYFERFFHRNKLPSVTADKP